jgi:hypothetical protein
MKITRWIALLLAPLIFAGCFTEPVEIPEETVGLAPVYADGDWSEIKSQPPQPIVELNKIYYKDSLIFVGESQKGIHIIDNHDPANPERIAFIEIQGNSDISIKGNLLYANNLTDLVVLNISDINNVELVSRVEGVFPQSGTALPANYFGFFECPDPAMGNIVGWIEKTLQSPECWR